MRVTLVQALPKGERGELAVELATEAGVDAMVPWAAARCVARWTAERAAHGVRAVAGGRPRGGQAVPSARSSRRWPSSPSPPAVAELIGRADAALVLHESAIRTAAGRRTAGRR